MRALTHNQLYVLFYLARTRKAGTVTELAHAMERSRSMVSSAVSSLCCRGLAVPAGAKWGQKWGITIEGYAFAEDYL